VVKPKKGRLHAIGHENIENCKPRKNNGYHSIAIRDQMFGVQGQEKEREHSRQHRCQTVDKGLFEKFIKRVQLKFD